MSITQEILFTVSNYPGGYRFLYDLIYDSRPPSSIKNKRRLENTVRTTLSRLKKRGLVKNDKGKWAISLKGEKFLLQQSRKPRTFSLSDGIETQSKKVMIVAFDIPEKKRGYRDWLRHELIGFGFNQIQKSVWFGPKLSEEFIEYLDEVNILKYLRFFKVSEEDLV